MLIIYSCLSAKMCAQHTYLPVKRHGMGEKHGETGGAWRRRLAIYVTKMGKTTQNNAKKQHNADAAGLQGRREGPEDLAVAGWNGNYGSSGGSEQ